MDHPINRIPETHLRDGHDRPLSLMGRMRARLRTRHYSARTEQGYLKWTRRFILFHDRRHPRTMGNREVAAFLTHLATERNVSASTQNVALAAIRFMYRHVLAVDIGFAEGVERAKQRRREPDVLAPDHVRAVLRQMRGVTRLCALLMYGSGLRVSECVTLRLKDVDFERHEITVRSGKGDKDRRVPLARVAEQPLKRHLERVKQLHWSDLRRGVATSGLTPGLEAKFPNVAREWPWQYVFPANRVFRDDEQRLRRYHLHASAVQRAVTVAGRSSGLAKRVTCHSFRHSFATELLRNGADIRTVQALLGHSDLRTTMLYLHVLNRGGMGAESPADRL